MMNLQQTVDKVTTYMLHIQTSLTVKTTLMYEI